MLADLAEGEERDAGTDRDAGARAWSVRRPGEPPPRVWPRRRGVPPSRPHWRSLRPPLRAARPSRTRRAIPRLRRSIACCRITSSPSSACTRNALSQATVHCARRRGQGWVGSSTVAFSNTASPACAARSGAGVAGAEPAAPISGRGGAEGRGRRYGDRLPRVGVLAVDRSDVGDREGHTNDGR